MTLPASAAAQARSAAAAPAPAVDAATRRAVVDSLARSLETRYVFPEMGKRMAADLRRGLSAGDFDRITAGPDFARALTDRMQGLSKDRHLNVRYDPVPVAQVFDDRPSPEAIERRRREMRARNYGFERVERLAGNVGYLEIRGFVPPAEAGATALAAMKFVANSDALIIDLRRNGGGDPDMVALVSTMLFPAGDRVHLNSLYWREGDRTQQFWTAPYVDVPRFVGEVYVLTSRRTFSAAEEFTYNLKQLKRATQVGETTGGGAHPGEGVRLHPHFGVFIATGRAINPISKDNWEGKGAVPEIAVPADEALKVAHVKALESLIAKTTDPEEKDHLERELGRIR